ncbi:DUF72 domain-containing protein [Actinokineospora auranticolor]|uniref:Uncharacterized protein YecE (DUF72 family) n=1 Tax=Actinokineospora auranticolor TaxID=155976 RepID=A0A2S6GHF5_9PSEU|nr:DUF72 domain-containing protein [Actinokineospora auranticolor]PPK64662.1 uncharacterized protein YecE (DUF72 family) [Actinokineospora auranticolor]
MAIRIGTSGWAYEPWRGNYYPRGLPAREELGYLARRVDTIEVNSTFYGPRKASDYLRWHDTVPDDFVFAVKAPRLITHSSRLRDARARVDEFFDSGLDDLGAKLGPVLWQLPGSLHYDPALLRDFLPLLPPDRRHAVEVRHASFADDRFIDQLAEHRVALVVADSPRVWPSLLADTTDFAYLRLHGDTELYTSAYPDDAIDTWAARAVEWSGGDRDVFVYLDNTMVGNAPKDAERLARRVRALV